LTKLEEEKKDSLHGNNVSNTITRVNNNTSKKSLSVEHKHGLNGDVDTLETVLFEHDFNHTFSVLLGIHGGFSEHNLGFVGLNLQLFEEGVVPDVLDFVPVTDDTVVKRVGDLEHVTALLGFVTNHNILDFDVFDLFFTSHDGATNHGGEDGGGEVSAGETAFDKLQNGKSMSKGKEKKKPRRLSQIGRAKEEDAYSGTVVTNNDAIGWDRHVG